MGLRDLLDAWGDHRALRQEERALRRHGVPREPHPIGQYAYHIALTRAGAEVRRQYLYTLAIEGYPRPPQPNQVRVKKDRKGRWLLLETYPGSYYIARIIPKPDGTLFCVDCQKQYCDHTHAFAQSLAALPPAQRAELLHLEKSL